MIKHKKLLFVSSFSGGYQNFDAVFKDLQFQVTKTQTLRKALSLLKEIKPDVILAEFVFAPTYGSQISNFESLFAATQKFTANANFIAFAHKNDLHHLQQVKTNIKRYQVLTLPVSLSELADSLTKYTDN